MIYEYRCKECEQITEAFRYVAERDDCPPCSKCGGATKRIFSTSVQFVVSRAFQLQCSREVGKLILPQTEEEKRYWDTFGIIEDDDGE